MGFGFPNPIPAYSHSTSVFLPDHLSLLLTPVCFLFMPEFCQELFGQPLLVLLFVLEGVILEKSTSLPGPLFSSGPYATGFFQADFWTGKKLLLWGPGVVILLFALFYFLLGSQTLSHYVQQTSTRTSPTFVCPPCPTYELLTGSLSTPRRSCVHFSCCLA